MRARLTGRLTPVKLEVGPSYVNYIETSTECMWVKSKSKRVWVVKPISNPTVTATFISILNSHVLCLCTMQAVFPGSSDQEYPAVFDAAGY